MEKFYSKNKINNFWKFLLIFLATIPNLNFSQSIPTSLGTTNCWSCTPNTGWTVVSGTPDVSDVNNAAATASGGLWIGRPLPTPPNGHSHWITIRDVGGAGSEEIIRTTLTGLVIGREYEVVIYSMAALTGTTSGTYSRNYIDAFYFQIEGGSRVEVNSVTQNTWGVKKLRFTATDTTRTLTFYPGSNGAGTAGFEAVNISVTLNAINSVPIAVNDNTSVVGRNPVSINVLTNDSDPGGSLNLSSVDLDPSTPGIQNTFNDSQGSWVVNSVGNVTFTPASYFSGMAIIPYTVQDNYTVPGSTPVTSAPATSSPAYISIFVGVDSDGDGITDDVDLDDDNDGILDALESPNCFYTLAEASQIISVTSPINGTSGDPQAGTNITTLFNGSTADANPFNFVQDQVFVTGAPIFTVGYQAPIALSNLTVTQSANGMGASPAFGKLYGSIDGVTYTLLTTGNAISISTATVSFANTSTTPYLYYQIRYTGTNGTNTASGSVGTANIQEITSTVSATAAYIPSANPKPGVCNADRDGDGIPNHLDLDSDNDGCPDAIEGASFAISISDLVNSSMPGGNSGATSGTFNQPVIRNLGNTVNTTPGSASYGVPTIAGAGQDIGASQDSTRNDCIDSDGDNIPDYADLDDDNDGILDAIESPGCFYTATEANAISSVVSLFNGTLPDDPQAGNNIPTLFNGSTADANPFNFAGSQTVTPGTAIFTITYPTSLTLSSLTVNKVATGIANSGFGRLFGSNDGVNYTSISTTGISFNTTNLVFNNPTTNAYRYYRIVYVGTAAAGNTTNLTLGTGAINEITSVVSASYIPSANPKPGVCNEDTDGDGIPNHLDLDSDNDGCPDAIEGASTTIAVSNLVNSSMPGGNSGATSGTFNQPVVQNLGNTVNTTPGSVNFGVPTIAGTGQGVGQSQNSNINDCIDADGDNIPDYLDLDDDNDGILDAIESPSCFYTIVEASQIVSVISPLNGVAGDPQAGTNITTLFNGSTTDANPFNFVAGQALVTGAPIFTIRYPTPVALSNVTVTQVAGGISSTAFGRLYGSNDGVNYTLLTATNAISLSTTSVSFANTSTDTFIYYQIRYTGTTATNTTSGTTGTANIQEITSTLSTAVIYNPSANPKPGICNADTDGDGIPNHLDLDSDGDGCPDALEGAGNFTDAQLTTASGTIGTQSPNRNFGTAVSPATGIPTVAGAGQGYGFSQDARISVCLDSDNDGIIDLYDLDDDNDGITDAAECGGGAVFNYSGFGVRINGSQSDLYGFAGTDAAPVLLSSAVLGASTTANHLATDASRNRLLFTVSGTQGAISAYNFGTQTISTASSATFLSSLGTTTGGGAMYNGDYYIYDDTGDTTNQGIYRITFDAAGQANSLTRIAEPVAGADLGDLAINAFGMAYIISSGQLYKLDLTAIYSGSPAPSSAWTLVGTVGSSASSQLFFRGNGELIGSNSGSLIRINPNTAANEGTVLTLSGFTWGDLSEAPIIGFVCGTDTDGDGIPNHLDLDSDNDGCPDAIEGGGPFLNSNLTTATGPISSQTPNTNLGNTVGNTPATLGIPTIAGTGQSIGISQDSNVNSCLDTDGDGIPDLQDLDDDNDGILDAVESPACFYTAAEVKSMITGINSQFPTTDNFNLLYNGITETTVAEGFNFTTAVAATTNVAGSNLFTITFNDPVQLESLTLTDNISSTIAARAQLFGSNNNLDFVQLSNTAGGVNINTATGATFTVAQNAAKYKYYKIQTTVAGAIVITDYIGEFNFTLPASYIPSEYPKPGICGADNDNDGIPNHLDLDSDGDGCPDAVEGGGTFTSANLVNASGALSTQTPNQNLGNTVGNTATTMGVPTIAGTGQTVGNSQSFSKNDCLDSDGDGIPDWEDLDDDNDGILDTDEAVCSALGTEVFASLGINPISQPASAIALVATSNSFSPFTPNTSYNFNFGTGTGKRLETVNFQSGRKLSLIPGISASDVYFRRNNVGPSNEILWLEGTGSGIALSNATNILHSYPTNFNSVFNNGYYNSGIDNVFSNDATASNFSNVERIDVIFKSPYKTFKPANDYIVVAERGRNDNVLVAAITSLDANGIPNGFGPVGTIASSSMHNLPAMTEVIFRKEPNDISFRPHQALSQNIGLGVITLGTLGVTSGQQIFGYAILPADYNTANIANWTTYPTTTTEAQGGGVDLGVVYGLFSSCDYDADTDGDGIPNRLDLDSDGDGCPDAVEGGGTFTSANLVNASGALSTQTPNQNLGNTVGNTATTMGVPTIAGTGQTVGNSQSFSKNDCLDSDGDGIPDWEDVDDDNDGILDTAECSNTFGDLLTAFGAGRLLDILPSDFGLGLGVRNQNVTRDISSKFGYPANSGAVIIAITNASVHPTENAWWTKLGESQSVWKVTGTMSAFVLMTQNPEYYGSDSKTIHIYDGDTVIPVTGTGIPGQDNQTPSAQWSTNVTATAKTLTNLQPEDSNDANIKIGQWRFANMNFGQKTFGFSTTTRFADPTYAVNMYLECDSDMDGIPDRLDLDSDADGCPDALEGGSSLELSQLITAGGTLTGGSTSVNQNICTTCVSTGGANIGLPQLTSVSGYSNTTGQTVGSSKDSSVNNCPSCSEVVFIEDFGTSNLSINSGRTTSPYMPSGSFSFATPHPTSTDNNETAIDNNHYAVVAPGYIKAGWRPADLGYYFWTPAYNEAGTVRDRSNTEQGGVMAVNAGSIMAPFYRREVVLEYDTYYHAAFSIYVKNQPSKVGIKVANSSTNQVYGMMFSQDFTTNDSGWQTVELAFKVPADLDVNCDMQNVYLEFFNAKAENNGNDYYIDNIYLDKLSVGGSCPIPSNFITLVCPSGSQGCTNDPNTDTGGEPTKVGITNHDRLSTWPESIPNGFVALESASKGFVITRVDSESNIAEPIEGMLIYDKTAACVKLYRENVWHCLEQYCPNTTTSGFTLLCNSANFTGTLNAGVNETFGTFTADLPYANGDGSAYTAQSIASTGVTGLTASLSGGNFVTGTGGQLIFTIQGTPSAAGIARFPITINGYTCEIQAQVLP